MRTSTGWSLQPPRLPILALDEQKLSPSMGYVFIFSHRVGTYGVQVVDLPTCMRHTGSFLDDTTAIQSA
ncbi:hypothetical protein BCO71033_07363 [Burkholderia contaminans]|uniref:Uncharacterized protein n=1 Tax=Burkholderia contaminans TaxID=488447 RepID=A0A6P3CBL8_9BURK|nr:hypothetical protein BCO71033_07363 [Burkholderia contaminans]